MTQSNILGLAVLALGAVLLVFAWRASNAPMEQMAEAMTGRFTGTTMWYLIGGIVAMVVGLGLLLRGFGRN